MAYTITLTDQTVLTTIPDGTINNTSTDLTLIGKNYAGYGTFLNDNFVHLCENFASASQPTHPLTGQLWWDAGTGTLKAYTGSGFKQLAAITSSTSQPTGSITGDQWWDTNNQQLNVYNGSSWTLVGPAFTSNTGTSGTIVGTILDSGNTSHVAVNVYVSNTLIGIYSKDSAYTPGTAITGFTTIKPGFNLVSTAAVSGVAMWGTASDASGLGNVAASNYARTDAGAVSTTFNLPVYINSDTGLTVGTSNTAALSVSSSRVQFDNKINNGDIAIRANIGGTVANAIAITGSTGQVTIPNVLAASGNVTTAAYLISTSSAVATSTATGALRVTGGAGIGGNIWVGGYANIAGNITSLNINSTIGTFSSNVNAGGFYTTGNISGAYFNGVAITSLYADIAERFEADSIYSPGTVVELGGEKEITIADQELSEQVFGVISTKPAHLMNGGAGSDQTHPPVAVNGRVPVKVIGKVKKGDRLVSAGNGLARAGSKAEITHFNVIGRSLQNKDTEEQGTILAIVKLNS